jgi:hypothetical protein
MPLPTFSTCFGTTASRFADGIAVRSGPPLPPVPAAAWHVAQVFGEHLLARGRVAVRGRRAAALASMARADARPGRRGGAELAVEPEEPEPVAVRRGPSRRGRAAHR